jgi:iron complex outermembrane recepter protein
MKKLFVFLLAIITITAKAQEIKGTVLDSDGAPVAAATISLMKDSSVVKLAITNDKGSYRFIDIKPGAYRVGVSHVNFKPAFSTPFELGTETTVPNIQLQKVSAADMQGVTVTARKPIIEVRADKTILNVEGTINAAGNDALELLRKSPGVTIDKDDNLSLAGKNGVQVYIDNRPTPLSGQDLANYLKTMQSSQIEAIEIITNPSAKYDAAGNAGIINIRLKKNKAFGTNGSAAAGWSVGRNARYNGSLNLNHRNQNVNVYGTYSYSTGRSSNAIKAYRSVMNEVFDAKSAMTIEPKSHNFKVGLDYTLGKKSSIGAIVNGTLADMEMNMNSNTNIIQKNTNTISRVLRAGSINDMDRNNYNFNLNYNYTGTNGTSLVVNADKGYFDNNSDQYQPNIYYDATGQTQTGSLIYRMLSPTIININSAKADYEQNLGKAKLGFGGKIAFINTDNDFQRYDVVNNADQLDRNRSNRFKYDENINAGYVNYNHPFTGVAIQLGLRAENTTSKGRSSGQKFVNGSYQPVTSGFDRSYTDFFPSAAVTFNKNPMSMWSLTYSRRIDRPGYQDLNPFEFKIDEYTTQKGNTELLPQYTNSFGLSNTYKYKLTTSLNFSHVNNLFTQLIDTAEGNKAFITKKNLATQNITSLNVSYPFMYKSLTVFANVNANYSKYKANFGNGRIIDAEAFGLSAMTQASMKFGKTKTWTAELTGFYNAPTIYQGTFKAEAMWMLEPGIQKQLFGGKGNVKASVGDVFKTIQFKAKSDFAGQVVRINADPETRMFKLNFSYRFGSTTVKAAKQKTTGAEDELRRAQGDGGGGLAPVKQ